MIVSIRGTNGAGKSHLVRRIMNLYPESIVVPYPPEMGKTVPMGVRLTRLDGPPLFVLGHYNPGVNGGVDTMSKSNRLQFVYEQVQRRDADGDHVLLEGANREDTGERLLQLYALGRDVRVVFIDHPVEDCVAAIRSRGSRMDEDGVWERHRKMLRQFDRFEAEGMHVVVRDRQQAYEKVRSWLRLPERCE